MINENNARNTLLSHSSSIPFAVVTLAIDNPAELLPTLRSVSWQNREVDTHIVVDGSSALKRPQMRQICDRYGATYLWRSPEGVYDAMRFALTQLPLEAYVLFLNSGDVLASREVSSNVMKQMRSVSTPWAVGEVGLYRESSFQFYLPPLAFDDFLRGVLRAEHWFPHPSTISRCDALTAVEAFSDGYEVSSDYATALRLLKEYGVPAMLPFVVALHNLNGISSRHETRARLENSLARLRTFGFHRVIPESYLTARTLGGAVRARLRHDPCEVQFATAPANPSGESSHFCQIDNTYPWPSCCLRELNRLET